MSIPPPEVMLVEYAGALLATGPAPSVAARAIAPRRSAIRAYSSKSTTMAMSIAAIATGASCCAAARPTVPIKASLPDISSGASPAGR